MFKLQDQAVRALQIIQHLFHRRSWALHELQSYQTKIWFFTSVFLCLKCWKLYKSQALPRQKYEFSIPYRRHRLLHQIFPWSLVSLPWEERCRCAAKHNLSVFNRSSFDLGSFLFDGVGMLPVAELYHMDQKCDCEMTLDLWTLATHGHAKSFDVSYSEQSLDTGLKYPWNVILECHDYPGRSVIQTSYFSEKLRCSMNYLTSQNQKCC